METKNKLCPFSDTGEQCEGDACALYLSDCNLMDYQESGSATYFSDCVLNHISRHIGMIALFAAERVRQLEVEMKPKKAG